MSEQLQTVKDVATISMPFIKPIIDIWLKPKLVQILKNNKLDKQLIRSGFDDRFEEYLNRSYEKNLYINTIVFQNQQKRLEDIYIPLTVQSTRKNIYFLIDEYSDKFIPKYKKVLITDTAGMGKSTILKWLFLSCIKQNRGIPIFIEFRKLSSDRGVLDEIIKEINPLESHFDKDFILKLINKGDFIFFFDGYDEIPFKERESVTKEVQEFISKASNNLFILSSRPESALASFGDFQQFSIKPLETEEAFDLLRKYDNCGCLSKQLIESLKDSKLRNLEEFLSNPMLVSLLYKAYDYKPTIPYKKHIFYRQVYDSLFEKHDLTKGGSFIHEKYSQLDIEDFHRILRTVGFITLKLGKIEFGKDELLYLIQQSKDNCPGVDFKIGDFLNDLVITVPLFNRDGEFYKWSHKSIQEYFAAQYICIDSKGDQEIILLKMYQNAENLKYINVLDLCYDIDYKTFRRTIILDIIDIYIKYCEITYKKIDPRFISPDKILERQAITFGKKVYIAKKANVISEGSDKKDEAFNREMENFFVKSPAYKIAINYYGIQLFIESDSIYHIINLLRKKKDLVITVFARDKIKFDLNIQENKMHLLNDDPELEFNKPDIFNKINDMFCGCPSLNFVLDLDKCMDIRNEVLKDENTEHSSGLINEL